MEEFNAPQSIRGIADINLVVHVPETASEELDNETRKRLRTIRATLLFLASTCEYAPNFSTMDPKDQRALVVAYAVGLQNAKTSEIGPAAKLYIQSHREYPKSPLRLMEFVKIIRQKQELRMIREAQALPAPAPPPLKPEEIERRRRLREQARKRLL